MRKSIFLAVIVIGLSPLCAFAKCAGGSNVNFVDTGTSCVGVITPDIMTFTPPLDWNDNDNTVESYGSGGDYKLTSNVITEGRIINVLIGSSSSKTPTWFKDSTVAKTAATPTGGDGKIVVTYVPLIKFGGTQMKEVSVAKSDSWLKVILNFFLNLFK